MQSYHKALQLIKCSHDQIHVWSKIARLETVSPFKDQLCSKEQEDKEVKEFIYTGYGIASEDDVFQIICGARNCCFGDISGDSRSGTKMHPWQHSNQEPKPGSKRYCSLVWT